MLTAVRTGSIPVPTVIVRMGGEHERGGTRASVTGIPPFGALQRRVAPKSVRITGFHVLGL